MLCFNVGKRLGKCVGDHVVGRAINKVNCLIIYDELNKMILYINVLGASVIRPIVVMRPHIAYMHNEPCATLIRHFCDDLRSRTTRDDAL